LGQGGDYVHHAILDFIVDGYLPLTTALEEEVASMEQRMLDTFLDRAEIARIFALRRDLMRFEPLLVPLEEVACKLSKNELPCVDAEARHYFRDVLDHVRRVEAMSSGLRDLLLSVFEFSNLIEQKRTGAITRQHAACGDSCPPIAIAGIYGINFEHMPELHSPYGYPVTIAIILSVCSHLYWRFRKARWL
jgi:magnesium transporter